MSTSLRVLVVEDSEDDALLIIWELRRGGYDPTFERVDTPKAMSAALAQQDWDIIIADYSMPHFSGLAALRLLQESGRDLPFIVVSGTIGEDIAVAAMKAGAHDYIMKDNLARLVPAIERELREAEVRQERKRAEEASRESERRYRLLAENVTDVIWTTDINLQFTYFSPSIVRIGYTVEEAMALTVEEFLTPASLEIAMKIFAEEFAGESMEQMEPLSSRTLELEVNCKDGLTIWTETRMSFLRDAEGRPVGILGVTRDITERKQAEEELRRLKEFNEGIVQSMTEGIIVVDTGGCLAFVNPAGAALLGYSLAELLGQHWHTIVPPDQWAIVQAAEERRSRGEADRYELELVRQDGTRVPVQVSGSPRFEEGRFSGTLAVFTDLTERKRVEEQLRQAQKMEAIGTLAGGIAHDFNNVLTGILGFASVIHLELPSDSPLRPDVETIIHSAQRASELTRQLLTFSRRGRVEVRPLSLNDVAREVIRLLAHTIDKAIAIKPYLAKDLDIVKGDPGQLHQMLINLCLNARDAMPQGGQLIIETQNVTLSEEKAHTELDIEAGQYVLLSVTDTGIGMDAETQQHLFEPFFTTKEQGRGLGLAMVYGIVRGHGGAIHVYSEPGQGSTFKVYLPIASRPAEAKTSEEDQVVGGTETVLVVDDEEPVQELLWRILEQGGYTVLLAKDGVEAVELYTRLSTEIDLVVLDIVMPRMGGVETYERLREINPGVKVLLSSGYGESGQAQDILAAGARGFLQKPYSLHTVLRKVREVLESIDNVSSLPTRQQM